MSVFSAEFHLAIDLRSVSIIIIFFLIIGASIEAAERHSTAGTNKERYTHRWAVQIQAGEGRAQEIAKRNGFLFRGQVCF